MLIVQKHYKFAPGQAGEIPAIYNRTKMFSSIGFILQRNDC